MKKSMIMILLLAMMLNGRAQFKAIATSGAGIFFQSETALLGDFEFIETRLMFGHKQRFGIVGNYVKVYAVQNSFYYRGELATLGLSTDRWWSTNATNGYFWVNSGLRWSYERGASTTYQSWQKDKILLTEAGLKLIYPYNGWFGDHLIMAGFQLPIEGGDMRYSTEQGVIQAGTASKKGSIHFDAESGIKKIPFHLGINNELFIEPILHVGCGIENPGNEELTYEVGGGIAIGIPKSDGWDRDIFKVKAFKRQYQEGPGKFQVELVVNLLSFRKN